MASPARTPRDLRRFGVVMGIAIPVLFWLLLPWLFDRPRPWWPLAVAGAFLAFALLLPTALAPVERVWLKIGHALGWINTRILLTFLFFVVILPLGLLLRAAGKLAITRRRDAGATSYRIDARRSDDPADMEKPF